ncbi:MAG: helix-turn-helix domain-containing protein [Alphaproteobacteria bacterium]
MTKEKQKHRAFSRGRTAKGEPNPIDVHVGGRVRLRRTLLGMSQEKLASILGLTFQQVQKYERGMNRIGASRLWDLSNVLRVPVSFFFEEINQETANQSPRMIITENAEVFELQEEPSPYETDPMSKKETLELVKAYYKISNQKIAKNLYELIMALSKNSEE